MKRPFAPPPPPPARRVRGFFAGLLHRALVFGAGTGATLAIFLLIPVLQSLTAPPEADLVVQEIHTSEPEPPVPEAEAETESEPEPEEEPPELTEEAPPLDLQQLELALNPGIGDGALAGDFAVKLNVAAATNAAKEAEDLFSLGDLDQKPRPVRQTPPNVTKEMRKRGPGTVHVVFVVDKDGRVEAPVVQKSTDSIFDTPAVNAVKQWKFEPGMRGGKPVRFRMRVPITFPKG